jgi:hypothetical protein
MAVNANAHVRRYKDLLSERSTWDTSLQDIADYVVPHRSNITTTRQDGAKQTDKLFDSTAIHSKNLLASSLYTTLTPATQPWLSLVMRQEELNGQKATTDWLEDCARRMHRALRQSNFTTAVHEMYGDLTALGTGNLFAEEKGMSASGRFAGLRFRTIPWGEYVVAEDAEGVVDTVYRCLKLSVRAVIRKWGEQAVSQDLREKMKSKPDEKVEILHAVYPREDRKYDDDGNARPGAANMAWASCYIEMATKKLLQESGFEEFPFMVPRWDKTSGETYGRGPSHTAIPDVKSLNAAKEFILKAAPLAMMPPSLERDDSVVGEIDRTPGGRNVVTGQGPLSEQLAFLDTKNRPDLSQIVLNDLRAAIRQMYYADQLVLPDNPQMTATEVLALQEQMLRLLGPTAGRLYSEFLNPLVERIFAIMYRTGAFLPEPQELQMYRQQSGDPDIDVEYEGPLARAQRTIELNAQERNIGFATAVSQFYPAIWDNYNLDKMAQSRASITGLPSDEMRSDEEIEGIRSQRAEQQRIDAEIARGGAVAEAAGKASGMVTALADANQRPA